jgi:hypothetical protein
MSACLIYCHGCKHAWHDDGIGFGDGECACTCQPGAPRYEDWVIDPPASEVSPEALRAALAGAR